jgi:hypothetical protein
VPAELLTDDEWELAPTPNASPAFRDLHPDCDHSEWEVCPDWSEPVFTDSRRDLDAPRFEGWLNEDVLPETEPVEMRRPRLDHRKGTAVAVRNRRTRAEVMLKLREGRIGRDDVIRRAGQPGGRVLLPISLQQLLLDSGTSEKPTERVLDHVIRLTGAKVDARADLTVGWLLDPRVRGRRFDAWLDALADKSAPTWPGFPYAPRPDGFLRHAAVGGRSPNTYRA